MGLIGSASKKKRKETFSPQNICYKDIEISILIYELFLRCGECFLLSGMLFLEKLVTSLEG